ncbi:RagB/SusD family nutrient uptake outer membrane protein [Rubrivirga litoralis]|uniref:RagB/SusD family nutrient uptake outer membrane protein n=1 Tax=Rubrivirga litoralis TaxID=3075598 RepID=A0ABU3BQS9_9BACT|nr:RagB/SusD family nutrient uptake outer membrane protein [Rubrivirga sp. F394]MDT0631629.1 RagB/SusD family nutrient uptake outer membrane protein [Rubrivirga sp. F394]
MTTTTRRAGRCLALALALAAPLAGCDLNIDDPNATTEEDAFSTRAGLLSAAAGLQRQYNAGAYDNLVLTTGITSRELAADNTFANLLELDAGGAGLDPSNANVTGYFREMYQTTSLADALIAGAQATETVEPALQSGLVALAQFYKAAALGALAVGFTDVVIDTRTDGPATYVPRQAALEEAVSLLASAEDLLIATPPNAAFRDVVPRGFDLLNTIRAYRARFALLAGDLDGALAAAGRVDPAATSVFTYTTDVTNPLFAAISPSLGQPSFAVRDDLGLESVEDDDGRIAYFTDSNDDTSVNDYPIETAAGFIGTSLITPLPAYVPDEMLLIRAEVLARQGDAGGAVAAINAVRTDTEDPFGLAANLDAYDGPTDLQSLLDEIYYNRATELFLQGLRLEDARRLNQGEPDPSDPFQRTRNFYPFPQQERLANPGTTPPDPAI